MLSQQDFSRFVLDFLVFGNAFWKSDTAPPVRSSDWKPHRQIYPPWCGGGCLLVGAFLQRATPFTPGSVFHLLEPDINQELTACRNISAPLTLPG